MNVLGLMHARFAAGRRVGRLSALLAPLMPVGARVLDVGAGDGTLAALLAAARPDLQIQGLDVLPRNSPAIQVALYDGTTIPFDDASFDVILLVDVIHHAAAPGRLLREAKRVASKSVIVKDHLAEGMAARATLRLMDWVGNARYGVSLPYVYWTRDEWAAALSEAQLEVESWCERLSIYPPPLSLLFDRSLHFLACLQARPRPSATRSETARGGS